MDGTGTAAKDGGAAAVVGGAIHPLARVLNAVALALLYKVSCRRETTALGVASIAVGDESVLDVVA